jgi:hypothetical protein
MTGAWVQSPEPKNTGTEIKNAFDGFINSPDMAKEKKTPVNLKICQQKLSMQKGNKKELKKTEQHIQEVWDNYKRCNFLIMRDFPSIGDRHQRTETRSSENTKQDNPPTKKNLYQGISYSIENLGRSHRKKISYL